MGGRLDAADSRGADHFDRRAKTAQTKRLISRLQSLGYAKDRFAGEALKEADAALFAEYKAEKPSEFLNLDFTAAYGLDGKKLGEANDRLGAVRKEVEVEKGDPKTAFDKLEAKDRTVIQASITGDRQTLKADAFIPAAMAVIYLLLFLYFKTIGGYKPVHMAEELTGGIDGPMQA